MLCARLLSCQGAGEQARNTEFDTAGKMTFDRVIIWQPGTLDCPYQLSS